MRVLQLGSKNWADSYELTKNLEWHFNDFPPKENQQTDLKPDKKSKKKKKIKVVYLNYDVVLITGHVNLTEKDWQKLKELVPPYHVLFLQQAVEDIDENEQFFLRSIAAQKIIEDPQTLINHLYMRYFSEQWGIRISPNDLKINDRQVQNFEFLGTGELKLNLDTNNQWVNLGVYHLEYFIYANKLINFWLTMKANNFQVRIRIFVQRLGADGDVNDQVIVDFTKFQEEYFSHLDPCDYDRIVTISIEVNGSGDLTLGYFHARRSRDGAGAFISGGKRIINSKTREDIAYYFNPGDLKPPLNVYFAGARGAEGFEAYFLMKSVHAPMLLFTDMRLGIGEFYDDHEGYFGKKIISVIKETLKKLNFDSSQLTVNGISMGTYPAIKYGAQLQPYAINVAKPLISLGYIATRDALERPDAFDTIFDIDSQIVHSLSKKKLEEFDKKFMEEFNRNDLSKTRLFIGYMMNDDYDDQAVTKLKNSPAVKKSAQFSIKGFPGRHGDDPAVNDWFIYRLYQLMRDFGRKQ